MKTSVKLLAAAALLASAASGAILSACSGSNSKTSETTVDSVAQPTLLSVDSVMSDPAAFVGDTIVIEGMCTHLCSHGATKAFLANADTTVMVRCNATEAMGGAFDTGCVGKTITVSGKWCPQSLSKSQIEALAAAEAEEISDGHCDTEQRASGNASQWLEKLNAQIAAGGDTTLVVAYYLEAASYSVPVE